MGEVAFNAWTVVALVVAAGLLFLLFRPMPKHDGKKAVQVEVEAA